MKRFLILALLLFCSTALASPDHPQEKVDYILLKTPLPVTDTKKVEVIEFFGYFCPHCYSLDKALVKWKEKYAKTVTFKRVHVKFNDYMTHQQKLFYTLTALGKLPNPVHHALFEAVQIKQIDLDKEQKRLAIAKELGIDSQLFLNTYDSPAVTKSCESAVVLQNAFDLDGVPCLVVDGKYLTSLSIVAAGNQFAGTEEEAQQLTLTVIDHLIERALTSRQTSTKSSPKSSK